MITADTSDYSLCGDRYGGAGPGRVSGQDLNHVAASLIRGAVWCGALRGGVEATVLV